jgi:hypothetical protein
VVVKFGKIVFKDNVYIVWMLLYVGQFHDFHDAPPPPLRSWRPSDPACTAWILTGSAFDPVVPLDRGR